MILSLLILSLILQGIRFYIDFIRDGRIKLLESKSINQLNLIAELRGEFEELANREFDAEGMKARLQEIEQDLWDIYARTLKSKRKKGSKK